MNTRLRDSLNLYHKLAVLCNVMNQCFQDDYAIEIMVALMSWCLVGTAF